MVDIIVYRNHLSKDITDFIEELFCTEAGEKFKIIIIDNVGKDDLLLNKINDQKIQVINTNAGNSTEVKAILKDSQNDILIVLEPFIMGNSWLKQMREYVYQREEFASTSAIAIRDRLLLEEKDIFFSTAQRVVLNQYCYVTEPVSPCIFFKRKVIDEIIDSDLFSFDHNYVKYMFKIALELGYKHVICENVAIISSQENSAAYTDVPSIAKDNLFLHLKLRPEKKNILYVLHTGIRNSDKNSLGGVQKHISDIISFLKNQINCFVAWHENNEVKIVAFCGEEEIEFSFPLCSDFSENICRDNDTFLVFDKIIKAFSIDLIHIHHIMGLNFEVFYAAKANNIPIVLTLHDYYFICPNIFLMYKEEKYCRLNSENKCIDCLKIRGFETDFLKRRREEFRKIVRFCDYIIVPDESVYEIYSDIIGEFKVTVIPNGICGDNNSKHNANCFIDNKCINVSFIGQIMPTKGSSVALDMIKNNCLSNICWHFFGPIYDIELDSYENKNIIKHGVYDASNITNLLDLNNIDIVCIPSQLPETFCYTLSEAWMAGRPVISSDIGALGNRIRKNGGGSLVSSYDSSEAFLDIIYKLNSDRTYLNKLKLAVNSINITTIEEMRYEYSTIYKKLITNTLQKEANNSDYRMMYMAYTGPKVRLISENDQKIAILEKYKEELFEIKSSYVYKAFLIVSKLLRRYKKKLIPFMYRTSRKFKVF